MPPHVARPLEDELEVFLLQRQVYLHQRYGRWLRNAFVDMSARGDRRACVNRCLWAWWAVTWVQGHADAAALGAAAAAGGDAGAHGGADGVPEAAGGGADGRRQDDGRAAHHKL